MSDFQLDFTTIDLTVCNKCTLNDCGFVLQTRYLSIKPKQQTKMLVSRNLKLSCKKEFFEQIHVFLPQKGQKWQEG